MTVRPHLGATSVDYITSQETRNPLYLQCDTNNNANGVNKSITWLRRECFLQGELMKITALSQKIEKVNNNSKKKHVL